MLAVSVSYITVNIKYICKQALALSLTMQQLTFNKLASVNFFNELQNS